MVHCAETDEFGMLGALLGDEAVDRRDRARSCRNRMDDKVSDTCFFMGEQVVDRAFSRHGLLDAIEAPDSFNRLQGDLLGIDVCVCVDYGHDGLLRMLRSIVYDVGRLAGRERRN